MAMTPQARMVKDALLAIGVARKAFSARTERHRVSWTNRDTGLRESCSEYGPATAFVRTKEARAQVVAHAQQLADQHLTVSIYRYGCGHISNVVMVTSGWNGSRTVTYRPIGGECDICPTSQ